MNAAFFLSAARAIIAEPVRWTRYSAARNVRGQPVPAVDGLARCWCAYGALEAVGGLADGPAGDLLRDAAEAVHGASVVTCNDRLGHAAVLAMYDRAIALAAAEAEGR